MTKLPRWYRKYDSMIGRCYRPSHPAYPYYGGRGVTVCDRWRNDRRLFLLDLGEPPDGYWLDRIDNLKGYEPGNCRWVTPKESARNRHPGGGPKSHPGSLRNDCQLAGLDYSLVYQRIRRGWPRHLAMSIPIQARGGMLRHDKVALGLLAG